MKDVIDQLYFSVTNNLRDMKKSEMSLSERIKYEVALAKLDAMKRIIDKYNF
jgi:hypothetical protein